MDETSRKKSGRFVRPIVKKIVDVMSKGQYVHHGTLRPMGRFVHGTLCPWTLCPWTLCPWDALSMGCFVLGRIVRVPKNYQKRVMTIVNVVFVSVIFAGGILANLMLGEPVLAPLKANNQLLLSTVVW
jgi:TRIC channel